MRDTLPMFDGKLFREIADHLSDGLYFVDRNRVIRYWNKAAERITGFSTAEVVGRSCADNILTHVDGEGRSLCKGECPLAMTIADGEAREAEVFLRHKNGHRLPVSVRVGVLTDEAGNVTGGVELFRDESHFKAIELRVKELEELALLDHLTRLANRSRIESEILARFEERKRHDVSFGILFLDIDHFKEINDAYGHDAGDLVLKFVADTLIKNSRPFDAVGRWGGEEFIEIIRNVDRRGLEHLGNRLRVLIEHSYIVLENRQLHVTVSIGATLLNDDDNLATLINRADSLLYKSKRAGRNRLTSG